MRHAPRLSLFLLILAVSMGGCRFGKGTPSPTTAANDVAWGMTVNIFPYPALHDEQRFQDVTEGQIRALKELEVEVVRFTYSVEEPDRSVYFAQRLADEGMRPYVILEDYVHGPQPDEETHGYQFTKAAIEKLGVHADYYQLANEVGGSAIKSAAFPGTALAHYDQQRLEKTLDFVRGASRAVAEFDPSAERIITINSLHTAMVQAAVDQQIDFEIIGWNWFSDFGLDLTEPIMNEQTGERYPFAATLKAFGKPLWVTEVSRRRGAAENNEQAQAEFIEQAVPIALEAGFRGIFPFLLVEDVVGLPGYGLLEPQRDKTGKWYIGRPRQAFRSYQTIVKNHEQ